MKRREFLQVSAAVAASAAHVNPKDILRELSQAEVQDRNTFFVSPAGNDQNPGTLNAPFATLHRAQQAVRHSSRSRPVTVFVRGGTYYLESPLTFVAEDSGSPKSPVVFSVYEGEEVTLSGGRRLTCKWTSHSNGIMKTIMPSRVAFSQLFVNGKRKIRARFPNYDPSDPGKSGYIFAAGPIPEGVSSPFPGADEDMTFSTEAPRGIRFDPASFTKKKWTRIEDAEISIYQAAYWGNLQWKLKGIDQSSNTIWFGEGGQQVGAKWSKNPAILNNKSRFFIENVFEELDTAGEWFLDKATATLYYYPEPGIDLDRAVIEVPVLENVVVFAGSQDRPVEHISLHGFRFAHSASTYLKSYDVPSLSDWAIHRGGTVLADGARNCSLDSCWFDAVGGNAVFVNNYNRAFSVIRCKFTETGDSAICFVGDLEKTNGTQRAFPFECEASNNLIHDCGVFGKQIAGVYISRAKRIKVSHNLIYNMPRAAICIGDGTWGGHLIEFNQTHDTVRETSDHGPFNAWGRDRGWSLAQSHAPYTVDRSLDVWEALVDAMEPVIVRNNFFHEKSGWGLDLDDGASNYEIYNNISTGGVSMKLREGAYRKVYNNIWYLSKAAPCFHVGNNYNHDQYYNNITVMDPNSTEWPEGWPWWPQMVYSVIAPPAVGPWFEKIDNNCFYCVGTEFQAVVDQLRSDDGKRNAKRYDLAGWRKLGFDENSIFADPLFVDASNNDFRVRPESPALQLGFKNFEMGRWGLTADFPQKFREKS